MELNSPDYYKKRVTVLCLASGVVFIFYMVFALTMHFVGVITTSVSPLIRFIPESALFAIIFLLYFFGNQDEPLTISDVTIYTPTAGRAFFITVVMTIAFLLLLSFPLFVFGGAEDSCFGSLLVALAGVIVIVTNARWIRVTIAVICFLIYFLSMFYHCDVQIAMRNIHSGFQVASVFLSLIITLFLSWKGKFSIFGEDKVKLGNNPPAAIQTATVQ